jgi:HEAT repeat protein
MRGLSMIMGDPMYSNGQPNPPEVRKHEILKRLGRLGTDAIPALIATLSDQDGQMRQNAAIVLNFFAMGLWDWKNVPAAKVDIRAAIQALTKALADPVAHVRGHAAGALMMAGPDAKMAIPALIELLHDEWEGARLSSCGALGQIGPEAHVALPALRSVTLNDQSADVRRCAEHVISIIEKK